MVDEISSVGELATAVQAAIMRRPHPDSTVVVRHRLIWFRGQLKGFKLLPTIYRGEKRSTFERELIRDLKLTAVRLLDKPPRDEWEWLFIARHHGFVSRLLDWSESPLIALYFALKEEIEESTDCILWMLDPYRLNEFALKEELKEKKTTSIPVAGHPWTKKYLLPTAQDDEDLTSTPEDRLPRYPIAIRAPQLTQRSMAQRAAFTIHGHEKIPLEELDKTIGSKGTPVLRKLVVPSDLRDKFLNEFHALGITESVLFPDLEGVIRNLHRIYSPSNRKQEKITR